VETVRRVKLLLTSAGVGNATIRAALVDLLGKSIEEADAVCIPTASYGHHNFAGAYRFVSGRSPLPMTRLGWKSLALLELTALPSMGRDAWAPVVERTDALVVGGGDALYLSYWMRQSGLADILPSLDSVWIGLSAGSMALTPRIGEDFMTWRQHGGGDETLGLVDFSIFPHVDHPDLPENTMAEAERWAGGLGNPAYAIDDETAIRVVGDVVDVVSEGHWSFFPG
jgi:dipeptidase E